MPTLACGCDPGAGWVCLEHQRDAPLTYQPCVLGHKTRFSRCPACRVLEEREGGVAEGGVAERTEETGFRKGRPTAGHPSVNGAAVDPEVERWVGEGGR